MEVDWTDCTHVPAATAAFAHLSVLHIASPSCCKRVHFGVEACSAASDRDVTSPHPSLDRLFRSAMAASEPRGGLPRAVPTGTMLLRHIRRSVLYQKTR